MARQQQPPGEAGGRRQVGKDKGSPRTGDGKTKTPGPVGSPVSRKNVRYQTGGGHEVAARPASRLRVIMDLFKPGKHHRS